MVVPAHPLLVVISGPSGAGKTTLARRLLAEFDTLSYSVSCTTRPPRPGEIDGRSYHFLSPAAFRARIDAGEFLEHAEVHGHQYGTLKRSVGEALARGRDILMDIDIQGAGQIRAAAAAAPAGDLLHDAFVDVFIAPPSLAVLDERLHARGQDSDEVIARRLANARQELDAWRDYRYLFVNEDLDRSHEILRSILLAEHHRLRPSRKETHAR